MSIGMIGGAVPPGMKSGQIYLAAYEKAAIELAAEKRIPPPDLIFENSSAGAGLAGRLAGSTIGPGFSVVGFILCQMVSLRNRSIAFAPIGGKQKDTAM